VNAAITTSMSGGSQPPPGNEYTLT
jgi:hypothetical protein